MKELFKSGLNAIGLLIALVVMINMTEVELKLLLIISTPLVLFFGCLLIIKLTEEENN